MAPEKLSTKCYLQWGLNLGRLRHKGLVLSFLNCIVFERPRDHIKIKAVPRVSDKTKGKGNTQESLKSPLL